MASRFIVIRSLAVLLVALTITGAAVSGWAFYIQQIGNVHAVEDGRVYRSNTLGANQLEDVIAAHGIRTILNLRGGTQDDPWYKAEREIAANRGIQYIDVPMSEDNVPDAALMDRLILALRTAPQPLLLHCKAGADRTGLASALYEYLFAGKSPEVASRQLSFYYGHFPWLWSKTGAMDQAFWETVHAREATSRSAVVSQ